MMQFPRTVCRLLLGVCAAFLATALLQTASAHPPTPRVYRISYSPGAAIHVAAMERVRVLYERAGLSVEFVPMPHKRSIRSAADGVVDGETGRIAGLEERFPGLRRVDVPLIRLTGAAYVLADSPIRQYHRSLLDSLRPGTVRGVQWALRELDGHRFEAVSDYPTLLGMLAEKRVDLILGSTLSVETALRGKHAILVRKLEPLVYDRPLYHYVNTRNSSLIPLLERTLRRLREEFHWGEAPAAPPAPGE